ncbi:MAG: transposase zinc-binding domain-containing protein [Saprospiraceae bacterium]|nr:transposase zinc-binding domain-containing protein [Saprospiraceae bacterium]
MRTKYELADVVKHFGSKLRGNITPLQIKVLDKISQCRTATLGGHEEVCDRCGTVRYSYNSCGDRHCPKCQSAKQANWIEDLIQSTLPVKHYHIIFTAPHQLNAIGLHNQKMYYDLLFSAVWQTLLSFGYTHYGVLSGAVGVLHMGSKPFATSTYIVLFRQQDLL